METCIYSGKCPTGMGASWHTALESMKCIGYTKRDKVLAYQATFYPNSSYTTTLTQYLPISKTGNSLSKGLQQMIIEKEIEQETYRQFREKVLKTSKVKTGDRRRLTKARVIDTEEATKAAGKLKQQKKTTTKGMERPFYSTRSSIGALRREDGWYSEGEGDLEVESRGFARIVINDEGREEVRRASRIAEMVANIDRVFEEHGRSFGPWVAK
ncbi:hypothetical protein B9Z19DRAFT_1138786 [Tuber borchii]|uniref:Uncharacterized protein n=1 Tax=Tuber borchii TaxID=42251 RepID=A0A2T6Z9P3_TUBBO|nr:hypothetical protein B9Z19DRAFT_1138786 [Tuber borchii]